MKNPLLALHYSTRMQIILVVLVLSIFGCFYANVTVPVEEIAPGNSVQKGHY